MNITAKGVRFPLQRTPKSNLRLLYVSDVCSFPVGTREACLVRLTFDAQGTNTELRRCYIFSYPALRLRKQKQSQVRHYSPPYFLKYESSSSIPKSSSSSSSSSSSKLFGEDGCSREIGGRLRVGLAAVVVSVM
ncbi:hypothetical protein Mapa_011854 [Marchantia paleacea]|nr:hypothetical protein Mapa_011854 [Marchantia paleacea]